MRICVATSYTANFAHLGDLAAATLWLYAKRHSCSVRVESNQAPMARPPAWHRIRWIPQLFEEGFDFVLWLDADALFLRFDCDIRTVIRPGKDLYMVRHSVPEQHGNTLVPNSGVMLIRNCPWSREFLSSVWTCERYIDHCWWENAAVISLLGYHSLLGEGEDSPNLALLEHVSFIGVEWNALPNVCTVEKPIVHHYAGETLDVRALAMARDFDSALLGAEQEGIVGESCGSGYRL